VMLLEKVFTKGLPIIRCPTSRQMLRFAFWKACVIKNNLRVCTLFYQLELHNRVDASIPVGDTPRLNDPLVGHNLDLSSDDVATEEREGTAGVAADFRGVGS